MRNARCIRGFRFAKPDPDCLVAFLRRKCLNPHDAERCPMWFVHPTSAATERKPVVAAANPAIRQPARGQWSKPMGAPVQQRRYATLLVPEEHQWNFRNGAPGRCAGTQL